MTRHCRHISVTVQLKAPALAAHAAGPVGTHVYWMLGSRQHLQPKGRSLQRLPASWPT
jgi:hypothetical protein